VEIECTLHNFVVLVINGPKIITVGKNLTKLWEKQLWLFFFSETRYIYCSFAYLHNLLTKICWLW